MKYSALLLFFVFSIIVCHSIYRSSRIIATCKIENAQGCFIPNKVTVEILDQQSIPISSQAYTNHDGQVVFENIVPGTYQLYCTWSDINFNMYEGFASVVVENGIAINVTMHMKN